MPIGVSVGGGLNAVVLRGGTAALLPLNSRIVFLGDSITAADGFAGYRNWATLYSGGRYSTREGANNALGPTGWNQGVVGDTTEEMIARLQNVEDENPDVVVVQGGGNDLLAIGADVATIETNLRSIYDSVKGLGAKIVAITVTPQNGQREADRASINTWIKGQPDLAAVIDSDTYLTDLASMLQADGVHPNALGAQVIGQPVGEALATLIASDELLYDPTQPAPAENLMANPFFTGANTIATGTIADDWSYFANTNGLTSTLSKTTLDGSAAQQITLTGTATAAAENLFHQFVTPPDTSIGDQFEAWIEIEASSLQGINGFKWQVTRGSSNPGIFSISAQIDGSDLAGFKGVLRSPPFALTEAGQRLEPTFAIKPASGAAVNATITLTRAGLRKV